MLLSQNNSIKSSIAIAFIVAAGIFSLSAEETTTIRLPGQHLQQHGDLLANQGNTAIQLDNATK